ncbi:PIG-X-domain-containing protein [Macroventuria anomochaeta]|uniref:PIG-X-domain-containing protein n=1 Tax=Macroventuria anomochaeta TaxID=301207 RepID=A0ACB6S7V9_9PLEO|nr:PIG-X-domain-containing protein [Macroventuria anomochaeta]KAF2630350.1 PIG-X-domain-containing protein [Macroventuria anomochaeta]
MKQRITYVVTEPESFTPEQISVQKRKNGNGDTFTLKGVHAAKEHRITLGLDELSQAPINIEVLKKWHELHIRWASDFPDSVTAPFTSRVSPGLHIFFTPSTEAKNPDLCRDIRSLFSDTYSPIKCTTSHETAIKIPMLSERFSMSTALQYYSPFSEDDWDASKIAEWFQNMTGADSSASYIDIDYDAISQAVIFTVVWSHAPNKKGWTESVYVPEDESTVEIGVLSHEPNTDPEDVQFGGFLTMLGRDDKPKPTRFQTPTRHYPLLTPESFNPNTTPKLSPLTYTTSINRPTGLHPTLTLTLPSEHLTAPDPTCKLHTYLTLPSALFIDKYQFSDPLFLTSKNLIALRSIAGATDLEAPDWVVPQWGSASLFELASPSSSAADTEASAPPSSGDWNVSIPLHLRYLPASPTPHTPISIPWPVVFWVCRADEGEKHSLNPFDRKHLGYEALFGPKTRFMHVQPARERGADEEYKRLVETIDVPVLDTQKAGMVEMGTVGVVVLAFLGLCWVLFGKVGGKEAADKMKKKQ